MPNLPQTSIHEAWWFTIILIPTIMLIIGSAVNHFCPKLWAAIWPWGKKDEPAPAASPPHASDDNSHQKNELKIGRETKAPVLQAQGNIINNFYGQAVAPASAPGVPVAYATDAEVSYPLITSTLQEVPSAKKEQSVFDNCSFNSCSFDNNRVTQNQQATAEANDATPSPSPFSTKPELPPFDQSFKGNMWGFRVKAPHGVMIGTKTFSCGYYFRLKGVDAIPLLEEDEIEFIPRDTKVHVGFTVTSDYIFKNKRYSPHAVDDLFIGDALYLRNEGKALILEDGYVGVYLPAEKERVFLPKAKAKEWYKAGRGLIIYGVKAV